MRPSSRALAPRLAAALLAVAVLPACGGGSGGPLYGGFAPVGGTAMVFPTTTCDVPFVGTTSMSAVAITLADFPDVCAFRTDTALCGSRAGTTFLTALAVDGVVGGTAPTFGPGTFTYLSDPPTGAFRAAIASAVQTTATCGEAGGSGTNMRGGRIVVEAVSDTNVTGRLELAFDDGSSYSQPFDLARCAPPTDLCIYFDGRCMAGFSPWQCLQPPAP